MSALKESPTGGAVHRTIATSLIHNVVTGYRIRRGDPYIDHVATQLVREEVEPDYRIDHDPDIDWTAEVASHLEERYKLPGERAGMILNAAKDRARARLSRSGEA